MNDKKESNWDLYVAWIIIGAGLIFLFSIGFVGCEITIYPG